MSDKTTPLGCIMAAAFLISPVHVVAQEAGSTPPQAPDSVRFDLQDVDIRMAITAIAEAGGLNITFSNLPERRVTLRTNRPVPQAAMRALLDQLAAANGLEVHDDAAVIRIAAKPAPPLESRAAPRPGPGARQQEPELRLFVYRLKHATSMRLASTLQGLFGGSGFPVGAGLSRTPLSQQLRGQRIPPGFPEAGAGAAAARGAGQDLEAAFQVVPDELTNSLLVRATATDWELIQEAIQALDVRPLQVLIEVLIAEVRRSKDFDLGLMVEAPERFSERFGTTLGGELGSVTTGDLTLRVMGVGGISADVVLSAISARAEVDILSRPAILAQNNHEARILVGSQRPFIQVSRALPTDAAVRDQIVQYRDVGTSLAILPTISEDGYVSIQLVQEVSTATNETQFGAPVISTREASTQLLVRDGQTIVIGGLIDRQKDRTRTGIPLLKDLPLIGGLFGSTSRGDFLTEMFLFLTPHIIRTDEDAEQLRLRLEDETEVLRDNLPPIRPLPPDSGGR